MLAQPKWQSTKCLAHCMPSSQDVHNLELTAILLHLEVVKVKVHAQHFALALLAQQDTPSVDPRQSKGVAVGVEIREH